MGIGAEMTARTPRWRRQTDKRAEDEWIRVLPLAAQCDVMFDVVSSPWLLNIFPQVVEVDILIPANLTILSTNSIRDALFERSKAEDCPQVFQVLSPPIRGTLGTHFASRVLRMGDRLQPVLLTDFFLRGVSPRFPSVSYNVI